MADGGIEKANQRHKKVSIKAMEFTSTKGPIVYGRGVKFPLRLMSCLSGISHTVLVLYYISSSASYINLMAELVLSSLSAAKSWKPREWVHDCGLILGDSGVDSLST